MQYGYVRVSSIDQETAGQRAAMARAGIRRVYVEKRSAVVDRPVLSALLALVRRGDVLVVYRLDRLARSLVDFLGLVAQLEARGVALRSLTEPVDTGSPVGRLMLQLLGSFAEFERALIRERCRVGIEAAKARGVRFGRRRQLDWELVSRLGREGHSAAALAERFGVHHTAIRWVWRHNG